MAPEYKQLAWTAELATGNSDMDEQHRHMLRRLDRVLHACFTRRCHREVESVLRFLVEYVVLHMAEEEALAEFWRYPGCAAHKAQHDDFRGRAGEAQALLAAKGLTDDALEKIHHLAAWLVEHIRTKDRAVGSYIRKQQAMRRV